VGKDQNTYAKRQREMNKKRKAEDKRVRRQKRKENGIPMDAPEADDDSQSPSSELLSTAGLQSRPGVAVG
jgi:hypothetical protein